MNDSTRILLCLSLLPGAAACAGADPAAEPVQSQLQTLAGNYADPEPYPYGEGVWGHRSFTFEDGRWSLDFVLSLDPAQASRVFRFRTRGSYRVLGASEEVPGAYDAVFTEEVKLVTRLTEDPGLEQAFGLAACGLPFDEETDVSEVGCAGWRPVSECPEDHDLLALTADGGVRFGVRPRDNDLCSADRRPNQLTPPVMRRP